MMTTIWKFANLISENKELCWEYPKTIFTIRIIWVLSFPFVGPVWLFLYVVSESFVLVLHADQFFNPDAPLKVLLIGGILMGMVLGMMITTLLFLFLSCLFKPAFYGVLGKMGIPPTEWWKYMFMAIDEFAVEFRKWNKQSSLAH